MNPRSVVSTIGTIFILVATVGLALWLLSYVGVHLFVFGSLPGLLVALVIGFVLSFVARRM